MFYTGRVAFLIRDRSLIIPGEGAEDIWEEGPKFYPLKGRGMKNEAHPKEGV